VPVLADLSRWTPARKLPAHPESVDTSSVVAGFGAGPSRLFAAYDAYLAAKRATANRVRTVAFDEEWLTIVKDRLGDILLSIITRETLEGFQAKRKLDGASNRTVNRNVGALRKVLKRYGHWRRLQDHVTMLARRPSRQPCDVDHVAIYKYNDIYS
jgi:hypothetical protein